MLNKLSKVNIIFKVLLLTLIVANALAAVGKDPIRIAEFIGSKIGNAIGVSSSVPANPFNTLALQLKDKENQLKDKEQELRSREDRLNGELVSQRTILYGLASLVAILFILVLFNFYFDNKRRNNKK
jgi:hypothetical protein